MELTFAKNGQEETEEWDFLSAEQVEPNKMRFMMKKVRGNDGDLVVTMVTRSVPFRSETRKNRTGKKNTAERLNVETEEEDSLSAAAPTHKGHLLLGDIGGKRSKVRDRVTTPQCTKYED